MEDFYNQLTDFYDLIYSDWEMSIAKQGDQLSSVISNHWAGSHTVLDASCGIGTQSLALSRLGYSVSGSDISENEIRRARLEAKNRDLEIRYSVCDIRNLKSEHEPGFDVVISCDNSIAHLLNDKDLSSAFESIYGCLVPGGGCVVTLRDYDNEPRGRNIYKPYGLRVKDNRRFCLYQIWDFDGDIYDLSFYFVEEDLGTKEVTTHVMRSKCNALSCDHVIELMKKAGFQDVHCQRETYFQPCILGTKPV